jgi:hypothetical protein
MANLAFLNTLPQLHNEKYICLPSTGLAMVREVVGLWRSQLHERNARRFILHSYLTVDGVYLMADPPPAKL